MTEGKISTLLQAIPLPSVFIGRGERILGANDQALSLLGQKIIGRHFITALRQPTVLDAIEGTLRDATPRKTRFLGSDGAQDTSFVVSVSKVETDLGQGALVCFEDVTHLEQAGQMRRDFVANVSHELRTPLTALMGFIETLQGPAKGDPAATERFLAIMMAEAQRMERLVRDLLSLSRVEAEERVRPTQKVDIKQVIETALHGLGPLAKTAQVSLNTDLPDMPVMIPGDRDQLIQVVTNLTENAIKYGGQGGRVDLSVSITERAPQLRGPGVILSVCDSGPGIDALHIPRLTERFYRIDTHRSREQGGTGLGLAIVKHIVNRHRGRLRIESQPGDGAEFRVILPR